MDTGEMRAGPEKQFDLLNGTLTKLFEGLINLEFRLAGFLLLVMGWLVTSQSARTYVAGELTIRVTGTVVVLLVMALHAGWAQNYYERAARVFREMERLEYVPASVRDSLLRLRLSMVRGVQIAQAALALFVCMLFWIAEVPPPG